MCAVKKWRNFPRYSLFSRMGDHEMRWRKVVPIGGPGPDYYRPFIL